MKGLAEYRKTNVFFFGNEKEKKEFYVECILPYLQKNRSADYFTIRDWNGGPNIEIVYRGEKIRKGDLNRWIQNYIQKKKLSWSEEQIKKNLEPYVKNQGNLLKMERKTGSEVICDNHLKIRDRQLDMAYYRKVYNSSEHLRVHFESRFLLQPLLEKTMKESQNEESLNMVVVKMMQIVLQLFEHGEKYASMVFFSHLNGMYGLAKSYQKEEAFKEYFAKEYAKYDFSKLETGFGQDALIAGYQEAWKQIYRWCEEMVDQNKLSEKGFYKLSNQEKQLKNNIKDLQSDFHQRMYNDEDLHKMVSGRTHLIFRSLVNILYNVLPTLQIGFLQKNFCIYSILEHIKSKYDTDWNQIMDERKIV